MDRLAWSRVVLVLAFQLRLADAQQYITDLPIFTSLAPCAASALSENVQLLTQSQCPQAVGALVSCVCQQDNNLKSIAGAVSSSVTNSCGKTASDDQASASTVLSAYCNQGASAAFPTPSVSLQEYITDFPAYSNLPPCGRSAISEAVLGMTEALCPGNAALLATCVCKKNQNSIVVTEQLGSSAYQQCSSQTDDVSSAQAVFSAYCGLLDGTTAFPTPSNPPGDMTYYITDLPQYSSLAPCAQSGLSYGVFSATNDVCPSGPQALASCVCLKPALLPDLSSTISSNLAYECSSTASAQISSAMNVYNIYCSAAKGVATPTGVTNSVAQSYMSGGFPISTGGSGGGSSGGGSSSGNGSGNSNGSGNNGNGGGNATNGNNGNNDHKGPPTGVIAGAVVGGVALLAIIGVVIFFLVRSAHRRKSGNTSQANPQQALNSDMASVHNGAPPPHYAPTGEPELHGSPVNGGPGGAPPQSGTPSPETLKGGIIPYTSSTSPVSPPSSMYPPPHQPHQPELAAETVPYPAPAVGMAYEHPQQQGHQQQQVYEFPQQNAVYEAGSTPAQGQRPQGPGGNGMGWHSGPVQTSYEMDGRGYNGPR